MHGFTTPRQYWPHGDPQPAEPEAPRPSFGPCEGRCNSSWRKAMRNYDRFVADWVTAGCIGREPELPEDLNDPWPGDPVFCRRCTATVRGALRDLPKAYEALAAVKFMTRSASVDDAIRILETTVLTNTHRHRTAILAGRGHARATIVSRS